MACDDQESPELLVVSGKILELSEGVYGIYGKSKEAGKIFSVSKEVKYKISWLPEAVKKHVRREPDTVFKYYYRILKKGNGEDWSTIIEIITN